MMDRAGDYREDDPRAGTLVDDDDAAGVDAPLVVGTDERRMQVRAYNHWVGLLDGRPYPSIEDCDPTHDRDFGPNSVLLDFTASAEHPLIVWLGDKLRGECAIANGVNSVADVPPRSLLSRLTDHYLQIMANRGPVGFEAEFVNVRGNNTFYRGILMPYSSDGEAIDFIYGVINWKEVVADSVQLGLEAELANAMTPPRVPQMPAFADGPHAAEAGVRDDTADEDATFELADDEGELALITPADDADLAEWLDNARASAAAVRIADSRSRAALYGALGHAYDFALVAAARPADFLALLKETGVSAQARAPMTPVVKLVFGVDYDKTRLTEFAAALSYAQRHALPRGGMASFLDHYPGGLKAVVHAERRERRPTMAVAKPSPVRDAARALPEQAVLALAGDDEFVLMVARRVDGERVAVIGVVPQDGAMLDRALRTILD